MWSSFAVFRNGSVCDIGTYGNQFKGQQSRIGDKINDGAFESMMEAIKTDETPNFLFHAIRARHVAVNPAKTEMG